jgi:hypothetical protein
MSIVDTIGFLLSALVNVDTNIFIFILNSVSQPVNPQNYVGRRPNPAVSVLYE